VICVVIPTIREKSYREFKEAWADCFSKHDVLLVTVRDGDAPTVSLNDGGRASVDDIMGEDSDLIYNKNDGVRNLGFAFVAKYLPKVEYIITLDDDVKPIGDPIADHISTLNKRVPTSWISTTTEEYPRGFPYKIRNEAEVVVSHGVWEGVKDWDAPTQLVLGNPDTGFYKGVIPKGIYFPFCGMNIAFKRKMLPYIYYAPMGYRVGMDRFADIWLGIVLKRLVDDKGLAIYTGGAKVLHERASNVWKNLQKEARGLELNEGFWDGVDDDPYFKLYEKERNRWYVFISNLPSMFNGKHSKKETN